MSASSPGHGVSGGGETSGEAANSGGRMTTFGNALADSLSKTLIEYETPRLVKVHNVWLGIIIKIAQVAVITYVLTYAIWYERGYQEFGSVESSVTVKVKGTSRSHVDPDKLSVPEWAHLYNRVWDEADYVVPPAENGAFFVTTNIVITPNQTQGRCPEDPSIGKARCSADSDCSRNKHLVLGHGPMTGRCVDPADKSKSDGAAKVCEIDAWCPVEIDALPLGKSRPIMDNVDRYTVYIKNSIAFPTFGKEYRRNNIIPGPRPTLFHEDRNPLGQIFSLGDLVTMAGGNFTELSVRGGVVSISIQWNCDLDWDFMQYCLPKYEFRVLDKGWNFRHAHFHECGRRTLIKSYGLRFVITVEGTSGRFSVRNTVLNVGNGLALLGMTTIVGEFFLLHFTKEKGYVVQKKYDYLDNMNGNEDDQHQETPKPKEDAENGAVRRGEPIELLPIAPSL